MIVAKNVTKLGMAEVTSNVRISPNASVVLQRLTQRLGRSKSGVVEEALQVLEAQTFAAEVREAYAKLRRDEGAWKDYMDEVAVWDGLSGENLPKGESW
ncbi:MAG: hypothetical protein K2X03_06155 [Bryobacteraceae bacterium]|nr:hypothetical protein [Bryobacteraceae bacterium]